MNTHRKWTTFIMLLVVAALAETTMGQAYCALRDPVRRVYELFPEGERYRTLTATVGPEHRAALAKEGISTIAKFV